MVVKNEPTKVSATLIVDVAGEFYDDEASEETIRYCVEQDLEDAGFDVSVNQIVRCKDCKYRRGVDMGESWLHWCNLGHPDKADDWFCADGKRAT